jgi:hypothetical protein
MNADREELGDSNMTKFPVAMVIKCNILHEYKHEFSVQRRQKKLKAKVEQLLFFPF